MKQSVFSALVFSLASLLCLAAAPDSVFRKNNLVAWCIVPFDALQRGPEARARMLNELGLTKMAYDWRPEHIPTFEAEFKALTEYDIELTAFWIPIGLTPQTETATNQILDLLKHRGRPTQIWITVNDSQIADLEGAERVSAYVEPIRYMAERADEFDGKIALYNHGGWFGEPENQISIIKSVGMDNVGIVYNFHHGHEHLGRFEQLFETMLPYLMALNLNGMNENGPKILPLGQGDLELGMLRIVKESGFKGPIGILDHRNELDAKESLFENIEGMKRLLEQLNDEDALKTY